jgi:hypothetical protein
MRLRDSRLLQWLVLWIACCSLGCASGGSTRLCDGFRSYQTLEEVRAMLDKKGFGFDWKLESQETAPADPRPPYRLTYFSGPIKLAGSSGRLRLTFYDGRLMQAEFETRDGDAFNAALANEGSGVPRSAGNEVITDVRTRLRRDMAQDGSTVFTWYDPKLQNQWKEWVSSHS